MVKEAIVYLSFHEPQRLKLPPDPIPKQADVRGIRASLLDDETTEHYFHRWLGEVGEPYVQVLRTCVGQDLKFLVHVSGPLLASLANSTHQVAGDFLTLLDHPNITPVCPEPSHSLSFYLDIAAFRRQMERAQEAMADRCGGTFQVGMAPQMCLNSEIYFAMGQSGFRAILADGTRDLLQGRKAGFLRKNGGGPFVCTRMGEISHRLAAVLNGPSGLPLDVQASEVARSVVETPGDVAVLGWEAHLSDVTIDGGRVQGLLEQLAHELRNRGVRFSSIGEIISTHGRHCSPLPLPSVPAAASEIGNLGFFLGHPKQQEIFGLMCQAYSTARLTDNEDVVQIALELAQLDILGLLHRLLISNGHRQEPYYLTSTQWSRLGVEGVLTAVPGIYRTFIRGITESFL